MFSPKRQFAKILLVALLLGLSSTGYGGESSAIPESKDTVRILTRVPAFSLTDHRGEALSSADLYGRVWVANFIYSRCEEACAVQMAVMNGLRNALRRESFGENVHFVSMSVDPEYDTPEVLASYVSNRNLDTSRWHFLTGQREVVRDLSRNRSDMRLPEGVLDLETTAPHNAQFMLVDWEGRIRGYYDVLTQTDLNVLKNDLVTVVDERTGIPESVVKSAFIDPRRQQQLEAAETLDVFHDFEFSDEIDNSGITFRHKIVNDVGISYKAVHYDHGNAIAVADVDLDGLQDIYFTTLSGTNELWRNLGDGRFENITQRAGLDIRDRVGMGASFADIDNDGDPDLYITGVRLGNHLFENDGEGHFKDISDSSGTAVKAHSSSGTFFDYDRDGLLDLFVTNVGKYTTDEIAKVSLYGDYGQSVSEYEYYVGFEDAFAGHLKPERYETSILFRNMGNNRFENVNEKVDLIDRSWTGDATVIDGNNDGWPDLYVLSMQGNDEYYENVEGKRFVRKSREVFPRTPWGAMGVKSFDYDNDGDMDLYITDMHSDMRKDIHVHDIDDEKLKAANEDPESFLQSGGNSIFGNAFYRNDGDNQFAEVSDELGLENYWPWGPGSGDLNADGFEDLFVASSMAYPFRYSTNSLFLNNNGKGFVDSEYVLGVEPRKNGITSAPWFELECAGANKGHAGCYGSTTPGRTVVWGAVGTRSSVIFDLDQDGDQDIVTLEFNQPPMVLISNLSDKKSINYLKVSLVGSRSNKSGIGAIVRVFAGEDIYTKAQDGKSGYLSQSLYPLYFGLGDNEGVDKIEVIWPSGAEQTVSQDIAINSLLTIAEP